MMESRLPVISDVYRCRHCGSPTAHGNAYCRQCGVEYTPADLMYMEYHRPTILGALPWNLRDRYRCVHCQEWIGINDHYCRGCGDQIDGTEKSMMEVRTSELAAHNWPSVAGLAAFSALVFWFFAAAG